MQYRHGFFVLLYTTLTNLLRYWFYAEANLIILSFETFRFYIHWKPLSIDFYTLCFATVFMETLLWGCWSPVKYISKITLWVHLWCWFTQATMFIPLRSKFEHFEPEFTNLITENFRVAHSNSWLAPYIFSVTFRNAMYYFMLALKAYERPVVKSLCVINRSCNTT